MKHSSTSPPPRESAAAWTQEADEISIRCVDEVNAQPRPSGLWQSYPQHEYQSLADEQEAIWSAEGEAVARSHQVRAQGVGTAAAAVQFVVTKNEAEVSAAHADHQHAARVLTPYVRREPGAKLRYWVCWPVLWLGDTAGVWSAAITNGDIPYVAFGQAFASGLAAACAGLVGSELKHLRMARARRRDPESLNEDEQRYQRLFNGNDGGIGIVKLTGLLSLTVVVLLTIAVFALRAGIEGSLSGLTFGLLAAATAIGSGLLGYSAADEVADLLAVSAKRVRRAEQHHQKLAASLAPRVRAEAVEAARSVQAEYKLRGQAARKRVESLSWRVLRRNPQVFGHGYPAGELSGVIGWRPRRGEAS